MDHFEFHKELYHIENERRNTVNESLSIPIAIGTGLLSFLFYLVTTFDYTQSGFSVCFFLVLSILGTIPLGFAVYSLIRAFSNLTSGFEYKGLPYPEDLLEHRKKLIEHYTQYGNGAAEGEEKYQEYLLGKFAEHTNHNTLVNDQKTRHVFNAKRAMVYALVAMGIACIPFGYNYFHKTDPVSKVEVVKVPVTIEETTQPQPPPKPQNNGGQGERPGTTATTTATGQADQGRTRADSAAH